MSGNLCYKRFDHDDLIPLFLPPTQRKAESDEDFAKRHENDAKAERIAAESDEDFAKRCEAYDGAKHIAIRVRLVSRPAFRAWGYRHSRIVAENKRTLRELRALFLRADWEELFEDDFVAPEHELELVALMRDAVRESVSELHGFDVDGIGLGPHVDADLIVRVLEHAELVATAYVRVTGFQIPSKLDAFSSGS